jgi:hypothetical protein
MGDESFVPVSAWLAALLSGSRSELERRGLHVHQELEDSFVIADAVDARKAFAALMRFVLSSVPDGCEIYLAASREVAPVSRLGAGQFTVRWQVTDLEDRLRSAGEGRVLPLRREPGESRNRVQSEAIRSIRAGFDAAGWDFSLDEVGGGKELLARVSRR